MTILTRRWAGGVGLVRDCEYRRAGFTLIEMLVSIAILGAMVAMIAVIGSQTSKVWTQASNRIGQFQSAQNAFELLSRTISQATLNTYYQATSVSGTYTGYGRASDLEFVSGTANATGLGSAWSSTPGTGAPNQITHAIFFAAPLGYTVTTASSSPSYVGLDYLLSNLGFYIQYSQSISSPSFLPTTNASETAYRFRLMEVLPPTENFAMYGTANNSWIKALWPTASTSGWVHQIATNIIALIISPEDPAQTTPTVIAPNYDYDSRSNTSITNPAQGAISPSPLSQLPPVLHVAMVAIDEKSALQLAALAATATIPPDPGKINSSSPKLFTTTTTPNSFEGDLATVQTNLTAAHVSFRVFETRVALRGSKWSSK